MEIALRKSQEVAKGNSKHYSQQFPMPVLLNQARQTGIVSHKASPLPMSLLNDQLSTQTYWGNIKPYCFDPLTNTPRVILTQNFIRSLLLNLFIIGVLCIAIPLLTNRNLFQQSLIVSPRYLARKYSIYIFSAVWAAYEAVFLTILLLGNPGYADPLSQRQISIQEQKQVLSSQHRNLTGYNKCEICSAIVDNSVFHCPVCDLCCEGFSHHCEWVGKCIGYRNQIYLSAYYYGFFVGMGVFVVIVLLQSLPFS